MQFGELFQKFRSTHSEFFYCMIRVDMPTTILEHRKVFSFGSLFYSRMAYFWLLSLVSSAKRSRLLLIVFVRLCKFFIEPLLRSGHHLNMKAQTILMTDIFLGLDQDDNNDDEDLQTNTILDSLDGGGQKQGQGSYITSSKTQIRFLIFSIRSPSSCQITYDTITK